MLPSIHCCVLSHCASVEVTMWFYFFVRILPLFKMLLTAWRLDVQPRDAICWLRPHRSTGPLGGLQPRPYLPKAPSPNPVPRRFGSPAMSLGGDTQTPPLHSGVNPTWSSGILLRFLTSVLTRDTGLWLSFLMVRLFGFGIETVLVS